VTPEVAPDVAGPVVGWRAWAVTRSHGRHRLRSIVAPTVWEPGVAMAARCLRPRLRPWRRHVAPADACECGIYAADLAGALEYVHGAGADYETVMRVFGSVALWGTVAEHEFGWRAEHAYPIELVLPSGAFTRRRGASSLQAVEQDLGAYGVPLRISDDPAALAAV
jgi:hypothetical protein